ncbi:MAG: replication initiator protein [Microvirus sp.]|nr:MAG: replication initiator protein [Microvirus sp.]
MICSKPFASRGALFGCGQCTPCRVNRRRQWTWRQWFESLTHEENCFVTLTYAPGLEPCNPSHLPGAGHLDPDHLRLFFYRLRKALYPQRIRYFACGEYGDQNSRPHYHLTLFGVSGATLVLGPQGPEPFPQTAARIWAKGHVQVGDFNEVTAQYVAGYVVKKWTAKDDPRLKGRPPEFSRMSLRPGIGTDAMATVAAALINLPSGSDVPNTLQVGRRKIPLGRFLLKKLRIAAGFSDEKISQIKQEKTDETATELLALFQAALATAPPASPITLKSVYLQEVAQKIRQVETRSKIYSSTRKL